MGMWNFSGLGWKQVLKRTASKVRSDDVAGQAAKLAFYSVLALFPMLLFTTALAGLLLQKDAAIHSAVNDYLIRFAPTSVSGLLMDTINEVSISSDGGKLSLGLLGWLWAASSGMVGLMRTLNVVYGIAERRPWLKARFVAVILTLGFALLMALAMTMLVVGGPTVTQIGARFGAAEHLGTLWDIARWPILLAFVLFAFNLLYLYAPNLEHHRWHWLMPGTVAAVLLWLAASYGLKLYLLHFNRYSATYGSIAGVIILLLWLFLSAAALLIGAELNAVAESEERNVSQKDG